MDEKILMLCGGQSLGGKMEIRLENPTLNNFQAYGGKNEKTEGFEMKNFSYTYTLFKGNHCIQSKIIEYGIILLRKYKVKQTEEIVIIHFFTHKLQEYLVRCNVYSFLINFQLPSQLRYHDYRKYSFNHILKVYKAPNQSVL